MIIENKWKLKARKAGVAIIEVHSIIKPYKGAEETEKGPMKIDYDMSGEQKGQIEMQETTGLITRGRITQQTSGQMKMEASGPMPEMSLDMDSESIISFEWSEIKIP